MDVPRLFLLEPVPAGQVVPSSEPLWSYPIQACKGDVVIVANMNRSDALAEIPESRAGILEISSGRQETL